MDSARLKIECASGKIIKLPPNAVVCLIKTLLCEVRVSLCNYCFYQNDVQQVMGSKGCSKHGKMKIRLQKKIHFLKNNFLLFLSFSKLKAVMQWKEHYYAVKTVIKRILYYINT